jgi:mannose-6-phosphate isomerase-like protein (cupin superfamily)
MTILAKKSIDQPDEHREFKLGHIDVSSTDGATLGKAVFEPGWRWSECVGPIAGTPSCEVHHNGYVLSGRLHVRMDDGGEAEVGPGDLFVVSPGHDAWTVGDEDCVVLDFSSDIAGYAKG